MSNSRIRSSRAFRKASAVCIFAASSIWAVNASDAIVAPYACPITPKEGNWGLVKPGYREFLTVGQRFRVRQNGNVTKVRLYVSDTTGLTGFYLKIWRKTENGYDLVGASENLVGKLVSKMTTTIVLDSPIKDVKIGDYYSYRIEVSGKHYNLYAQKAPKVKTYLITGKTPSEKGFSWESQKKYVGLVVPMELYMPSPKVVFIGDSIVAGHPANFSFLETNSKTDLNSSMEKHFEDLTGYAVQNMGIGSQTSTQISERFNNDVVALKPEMVVIEGGVNDISLGKISKEKFLNNWKTMLSIATEHDIKPVVLLILPWTTGNAEQMRVVDDWNAALKKLAKNYDALIVDASSAVGEARKGGPKGNRWNIQPAYSADGIHYNAAGYKKIAETIWSAIKKAD